MASNMTKDYSNEVIANISQAEDQLVIAKYFMMFKIGKCILFYNGNSLQFKEIL